MNDNRYTIQYSEKIKSNGLNVEYESTKLKTGLHIERRNFVMLLKVNKDYKC